MFITWFFLFCSRSLGQAAPDISAFIRARAAAYPIFEMIERNTVSKTSSKTGRKLSKVEGNIELKDVSFSYPSRPDVVIFDRFCLNLPAGKIVALVGGSGSGKSTVISLIERFYEPLAGEILLDGNNIKDLDLKWLRQQIGLVNQEPVLFATTIRENILYGKDDATLDEITRAAKLSEAIAFINNLPDRFETQVGERGIQLSGGQKQRIAISRAIVKNPSILLLDEATSALDAESEKSVQEALDRVMVGRTTVVVAHRLSTIRNADVIAVVQSGKIVETGTHDELISNPNSTYSSLVQLQETSPLQRYPSQGPTLSRPLRYIFNLDNFDDLFILRCIELEIPTQGNPGLLVFILFMLKQALLSCFLNAIIVKSSLIRSFLFFYSVSYSRELSRTRTSFGASFRSEKDSVSRAGADAIDAGKQSYISPGRLYSMIGPDWYYGVFGTVTALIAGAQMPLFALGVSQALVAYYMDWETTCHEVKKIAILFCCAAVITVIIHAIEHLCFGIMGERLTLRVREGMFSGNM